MRYEPFQSSEHLNEQRLLYQNCFPEAHLASGGQPDHYQWKFHDFPGTQSSFEYAAWKDSRLLGYYAALPFRYKVGEKTVTAGMVCDVMTHSAARGQGVFTGLGRYSIQQLKGAGVDFVTGYPIRPEVLPGHLKVGWKVAFELPLYFKVLRTQAVLSLIKLRFLAPLLNGIFALYRSSCSAFQQSTLKSRAMDGAEFLGLSEYETFFSEWSKGRHAFLIKDLQFLKWRLSAPRSHYRAITVWQGPRIVGVAIAAKVDFRGIPCFALLDFMVLEEPGCLVSLHRALEADAKTSGVDMIVSMMSRTTAKRCRIFRNGFLRSPAKYRLIVNRLDETVSEEDLLKEAHWDLMWIDSDDN